MQTTTSFSLKLLAGHPQGEGDEEGGQGSAGGYSQTHHGQEPQQRCQQDVTPVPDQGLQPLTKLEREEMGADNKRNYFIIIIPGEKYLIP